jgi:hypothetical protein
MDYTKDINKKDFGEYISRSSFNWFNEETKDNTYDFEGKISLNKGLTMNKNKTKLIANIKKDYNLNTLQCLADEGVKAIQISGACFKKTEYKKLIRDLGEAYTNDTPSVIFDLKGSLPYITRVGQKKQYKAKFGEKLKLAFDNPKIKDEDVIFVDKRLVLTPGDLIYVNSSDVILRVIEKNRYCDIEKGVSIELPKITNMRKASLGEDLLNTSPLEDLSFSATHFDTDLNDRIIHRQLSIQTAYKEIIKKSSRRIKTDMCLTTPLTKGIL